MVRTGLSTYLTSSEALGSPALPRDQLSLTLNDLFMGAPAGLVLAAVLLIALGSKRSLVLSLFVYVLSNIALLNLELVGAVTAGIIQALAKSLFWMSVVTMLGREVEQLSSDKRDGLFVLLLLVTNLGSMFASIISGLMSEYVGLASPMIAAAIGSVALMVGAALLPNQAPMEPKADARPNYPVWAAALGAGLLASSIGLTIDIESILLISENAVRNSMMITLASSLIGFGLQAWAIRAWLRRGTQTYFDGTLGARIGVGLVITALATLIKVAIPVPDVALWGQLLDSVPEVAVYAVILGLVTSARSFRHVAIGLFVWRSLQIAPGFFRMELRSPVLAYGLSAICIAFGVALIATRRTMTPYRSQSSG